MLVEKAQVLLKKLYDNPRLAVKLSLGAGCERVAYKLDEQYAVKIEKCTMYNEEVLKECEGEDIELDMYSRHLWDSSFENQTEREINMFKSLTEEEASMFNPIVEIGEFNGATFTISPLVETASSKDCYDIEALCEKLNKKFDYEALKKVSNRFSLDYYDLTENSDNFGVNSNGDIVIIDYGLEEL